jgi:DNA-binding protein HU-beta
VTKQEFVDAVAGKAGLSKRDAGEAVDAFLDVVTGTLQAGDAVTFTGFGKFHTTKRAARMGVNPRTGAPVHINAATVPKFSAGSQLKKAVNP